MAVPCFLDLDGGQGAAAYRHAIAGGEVIASRPLTASALALPPAVLLTEAPAPSPQRRAGQLTFQRDAWLAGRVRRVTAWWDGPRGWFEIEPGLAVALDLERSAARLIGGGALAPGEVLELALGPLLLPLLAVRDVFVLHASAAAVEGRLLAFVGPSGAGKSTLAAAQAWQRVADDLLPVSWPAHGPTALADFPQLKVAPPALAAEAQPLAGIIHLRGPGSGPEVALEPLRGAAAASAVLAHWAGAHLLAPAQVEAHFRFAMRLAASLPVWELRTARDLGQLTTARQRLTALAAQLPAQAAVGEAAYIRP